MLDHSFESTYYSAMNVPSKALITNYIIIEIPDAKNEPSLLNDA